MVEAGRRHYYRPELDLLRFGAFLLVFLSHVAPGDVAFYGQIHIPRPIRRHTPLARLARICAGLAVTIAVAACSYLFLERPFLRLKDRFAHIATAPQPVRISTAISG